MCWPLAPPKVKAYQKGVSKSFLGVRRVAMESSTPTEVDGPSKRRRVEIFGIHELVLKPGSKSGYKDVYPLQRKKHPWQAKAWDPARKAHVSLGSFATPHEAAVAVATARMGGLENQRSPDQTRAARKSGGALSFRLPSHPFLGLLAHIANGRGCLHRKTEGRGDAASRAESTPLRQRPRDLAAAQGVDSAALSFRARACVRCSDPSGDRTANRWTGSSVTQCCVCTTGPTERACRLLACLPACVVAFVPVREASGAARTREVHAASVLIRFFDTVLCAYVRFDTVEASVMIATQV
jgi:hypothetical protein